MTNTGIYEWVIIAGHPREVPSLITLGLTFDVYSWTFVTISTLSVTFLLYVIDITWNYMKNGNMTKMRDYNHQGTYKQILDLERAAAYQKL